MNKGNAGSYFLENFVKLPRNTNTIQEINGTKMLNILYEMDYTSELMIRIETNYNAVLLERYRIFELID